MAQAKFVPILTTTTGLNNALDPVRLAVDLKTGETELSQAVNVDIDNSGRVNRRRGRTRKAVVTARSGFAAGETCLFVSGTELRLLAANYTSIVLRSDLTLNRPMRYIAVAGRVYYTNGIQIGYVSNGSTHSWSSAGYELPEGDNRTIYDPPVGDHLGWFAGRLLVAKGNAIFASEPSFYGAFDLHGSVRLFPSTVTMMRGVEAGLLVGMTDRVEFYRGTKWEELRREPVVASPAIAGSDCVCPGYKLGIASQAVVFTCADGVYAADSGGAISNLTTNKLKLHPGNNASAVVAGDRYIVFIEP